MITKRPRAGWSLRTGLLLSFGLSTLFLYCLAQALIVFGVPHTSFKGLWASQTQAAADVLDTMADTRKSQLERWVFERRGDVQSITENPLLQAAVQTILQPPSLAHEAEAELALTRLRLYLHRVKGSHYGEYSRLEIIDPSGKILVSSRPEDEGKTTSPPPYFSKALNPAEEEVVANEPDDDGGKTPDLVFARGIHTPAEGGATSTLAVLVLHNTMDSIISSLLHEGLGHSGEIVIVDQDSRLMAPLRYPLADGSMAQPLVFINPAKPAALAAQGIETMIEALDYRGVEVLAVTRHLRITSELAWGLEIKIDASEIHQPIRQAIIAHALVIAGALLAGIFLTMLLAAWLSTPLVSLSQAAVSIAAGDLSVRTTPAGSREMQNLARFFNIMIQRLEDWHRDLAAEVEKRTTQLTITNQALLASEARYRRIVETSGEGIWVTEADYLTSFINPQLSTMLGYQAQEMQNRPVSSFVADEDQALHQQQIALRKNGQSSRYEVRFKRQDGFLLWTMVAATPIMDGQGQFLGSLAMISDISEQKALTASLHENQARLDLALRSAGMGVFQLDIAAERYTLDDYSCHLFGLDPQTFAGTAVAFSQTLHPEDRELPQAALRQAIDQDLPYEAEYRILWSDGTVHHLAARGRLARGDAGQPTHVNGIVWDISAAKRAVEERAELESRLRQSQKMEAIGTLAGGIAHDFNNILSAIFGYTELAMGEKDPGRRNLDLDQVLLGAERAKELVKQILAFSRRSEQERQPLQVGVVIKEALKMLRSSIPSTIEIKQDVSSKEIVLADPTQIHQIIMNLCTNAYHAMRETGGILAVSAGEREIRGEEEGYGELVPGRYLNIEVSDTGCGISPEIQAKIFEPYFTTKPTGEGTGLGLAVVHGIIKSYHGHITVYSEPGAGTTFHVYLPLVNQKAAALPVKESLTEISGHGERILFVDDEAQIREFSKIILSMHGYQVTAFTNGVQALEEFQRHPEQFDLVITDMTMPYMTGAELAQRLLGIRPKLPIILCTGQSELINKEKAYAMGVCDYLNKPVPQHDFLAAIDKALKKNGTV